MTARVTITDLSGGVPGNTYVLLCDNVVVGGKKNTDAKPNVNIDGPVEVQTLSKENLQIVVNGILMPETANNMTYDNVLFMFNQKYTGANKIFLKVEFGRSQNKTVIDDTLQTTDNDSSFDTAYDVSIPNTTVSQFSVQLRSTVDGAQYGGRLTYTYSDATTAQELTGDITQSGDDFTTHTFSNPNPTKLVTNIRVEFATDNSSNIVEAQNFIYNYFEEGSTVLKGSNLTQSYESLGIPVVLTAFNYPLSTRDSVDAYMPKGSLTFLETE